jgi:hypothetical protein
VWKGNCKASGLKLGGDRESEILDPYSLWTFLIFCDCGTMRVHNLLNTYRVDTSCDTVGSVETLIVSNERLFKIVMFFTYWEIVRLTDTVGNSKKI